MYETLNYDVEDGIATICLDRADSANAMNPLMAKELNQVSLDVSQQALQLLEVCSGRTIEGSGQFLDAESDVWSDPVFPLKLAYCMPIRSMALTFDRPLCPR